MQISRPNGGSLTSTSTRKAISSTSPLDGHSRSPLSSSNVATTATTRQLAGQMGSMSVNNSMASKAGLLSHKKSKSISASSSAVAGPSTSTTAANSSRGRLSPTKPQAIRQSSSSSSKTPSRNNATLLSKSAGPSTSARDAASHSLIAAGGLGRMDIATKDWDGITSTNSSSAGSSPNKRRPASISAKKYDRFIPSRENSGNSVNGTVEENTTSHSNSNTRNKIDDSFEADNSRTSDADAGNADSFDDDSAPPTQDHTDQQHTADLTQSLGIDLGRRILSFAAEPPPASNEHSSLLAAYARGDAGIGRGAAASHQSSIAASQRRRIATTPERVLDAPGLVDDYYLNLLDWSSTNYVAIALSESVYIWNAETGDVGCLCSVTNGDESSDEIVCSVKFSEDGSYLAVGTSSGPIQIYDLSTSTRIRTMAGHATRVPSLSWSGAILSSGSRDGSIWNSDVRVAQHKIAEMNGHRAEVCGLEWRKDTGLTGSSSTGGSAGGMGLLASGGNDNVVNVWDGRMLSAPKMMKTNHTAAVKAIAWCPWQSSLLATGGGSSDRTIHFWNTTTSARLNSLVTPSQVTSLAFNPHSREILSSHGFPENQLSIWTYPTLSKVIDITKAHETRVLHSCINPDGTTVATASSDENLKFWKVFDLPKKTASSAAGGSAGSAGFAGKGNIVGEGKGEHDIGRRGRTGLAIR